LLYLNSSPTMYLYECMSMNRKASQASLMVIVVIIRYTTKSLSTALTGSDDIITGSSLVRAAIQADLLPAELDQIAGNCTIVFRLSP